MVACERLDGSQRGLVPRAHLICSAGGQPQFAIVLFHFDAELATELTVPFAGVVQVLAENLDEAPGWLLCKLPATATIGLVPADYLRLLGPNEDPDLVAAQLDPDYAAIEDQRVADRAAAYDALSKGDYVRVTAPFNSQFDTELAASPGDILKVAGKQPPEWLFCKVEALAVPDSSRAKARGLIPFGYCLPSPDYRPPPARTSSARAAGSGSMPSLPPRSSSLQSKEGDDGAALPPLL